MEDGRVGSRNSPLKVFVDSPNFFQSQRPRWREKIGHHEGEGGVGREIFGD